MKPLLISLCAFALAGCASTHYAANSGTLTVTSFTADGCVKELHKTAQKINVQVTLQAVQPQWTGGYECTGIVDGEYGSNR